MTRDQLFDRLKDYLNKPNLTETAFNAFVENTEATLNRTLEHPRMMQRVDLTTSPLETTKILALPSDLLQLNVIRINDVIWEQFPATYVDDLTQSGVQGYITRGDCVEFFPALAESTEVFMDYRAAVTPLTDDVPENWVSRTFPEAYLYGCLKEAAVYLKDDQRLQLWAQQFATIVDSMNSQGWNQNISSAPRVRLR
jgi:hypothetical protein